jgi:hypothetical protein
MPHYLLRKDIPMNVLKLLIKPRLLRPIVYKFLRRSLGGYAAALVWRRFINPYDYFSITIHAFMFLGILFFTMAWFNYLNLDGIKLRGLLEIFSKNNPPKRKSTKAMIDYTDIEPDKTVPLTNEEEKWTALSANFISGIVFLGISLIDAYVV